MVSLVFLWVVVAVVVSLFVVWFVVDICRLLVAVGEEVLEVP